MSTIFHPVVLIIIIIFFFFLEIIIIFFNYLKPEKQRGKKKNFDL
jgi:hypothetical protein